jgi:hypothetical protein
MGKRLDDNHLNLKLERVRTVNLSDNLLMKLDNIAINFPKAEILLLSKYHFICRSQLFLKNLKVRGSWKFDINKPFL